MFKPNLGFVILFVENPLKSAEFYSKILGLKPEEESPTFVLFAMANGVMLGLWSRHTAKPKVNAQPGAGEICFIEGSDGSVNALHAQWQQLGVTMLQAPHTMEGGYSFVAVDPDGHRIRILRIAQEE